MTAHAWSPERDKMFNELADSVRVKGGALACCPACGCYMGKCHDEEDVDTVWETCPCYDMADDDEEGDDD